MCENLLKRYPSPHACGAWIEVKKRTKTNVPILVAPRMWGVD
ncbi:hypothetical protein HMPREF1246_1865 [Acidaminococcus sp. BV3L6]|nr:hypothetical protein HMPREF1246_1865 [Acidaminococcus sp. BV3L6]